MVRKFICLLLVATAVSSATFAQGFHLGVKGGANLFKIDNRSFDDAFRYGYNLGAFSEINFSKHLGIQPELMWNETRTRTTSQFDDVYHTSFNELRDVKLNYLTIPILLSYRLAKFISLQAGPQFGVLLNQHETVLNNGRSAFRNGDFSVVGGVQLNIAGLKLGGRYASGITNINNLDSRDPWKNHSFQLYVGFRII